MRFSHPTLPRIINIGTFDSQNYFPAGTCDTEFREIDRFEIEFYTASGGIARVDGMEHPISRGGVLCSKPGQRRSSRLPFRCYYIYLQNDNGAFCQMLRNCPDMLAASDIREYIALFDRMLHTFYSPFEGSDILLCSQLAELLYHIYVDAQRCKRQVRLPGRTDNRVIAEAIQFIHDNYKKPIDLKDIAQHVNLSPIYFHKIFSTLMDQSPRQYLLKTRIATAKRLLLTTDLPLSAVADESGFSSQAYFNYTFKQQTGQTPGQYRRQLGRKDRI